MLAQLLNQAIEKGVYLYLENDKLKFKAKKDALSDDLKLAISRNKAEIIEYLQSTKAFTGFSFPELVKPESYDFTQLSYSQQRLWFISQMDKKSSQYNMPGLFKLKGELHVYAFERAVQTIVSRHDILRTNYYHKNSQLTWRINTDRVFDIERFELTHLKGKEQKEQIENLLLSLSGRPFDLEHDLMLRVALIHTRSDETIVFFDVHHIACDGWSIGLIIHELTQLYNGFIKGIEDPLPPLHYQYADFISWQRSWLSGDVLANQLDYWVRQLEDIPKVHKLPLDGKRGANQIVQGDDLTVYIKPEVVTQLRKMCVEQDVTLFMLLQSSFSVLLSRYSGEEDIVMGTPVANRVHKDIEPLIGFFVNTLVLRSDLSDNPPFIEFLQRNKRVILDAFEHQHIPFDMLVEELQPERNLSVSPVFQILFTYQNNEQVSLKMDGLSLEPIEKNADLLKFDLELSIIEIDDSIAVNWAFNKKLFSKESVNRWATNFNVLVEQLCLSIDTPIHDIDLIHSNEQQRMLSQWNDRFYPFEGHTNLVGLFESQVQKTPDNIAISCEGHYLTYQALNEKANQVANWLKNHGVKHEDLIGLCLKRNSDLVVSILATLKVGAAYVPLDPAYPEERVSYMFNESQLNFIIAHEHLQDRLPVTNQVILWIDNEAEQDLLALESVQNLNKSHHGSQLSHVIYTSGSTGRPKGVCIEHKAVIALINWLGNHYTIRERSRVLFSTSYCFDLSVFEIWSALSCGGEICLVKDILSLVDDRSLLPSLINTVPSALTALLDAGVMPDSVNVVNVAGEPLKKDLVNRTLLIESVDRLYNLYGPSEDTTYSTFAVFTQPIKAEPTIGIGLDNTFTLVVSDKDTLTPQGAIGELLLGGEGLSRGYLKQPELTADKFFDAEPILSKSSWLKSTAAEACLINLPNRLYRTGDLVRYLPNGELEFLGRADSQVKVRGFRIELGDVESHLSASGLVKQSAVIVYNKTHKGNQQDNQLVAYISPDVEQLIKQHKLSQEGSDENSYVNDWQVLFNNTYNENHSVNESELLQFHGWNSSYTGNTLSAEVMEEWVQDTVDRIEQLKPSSVLEVGVGTGMLVTRYAQSCSRVVACDISVNALSILKGELKQLGISNVELRHSTATESFNNNEKFDLVVINSVSQYFPNESYLSNVIEQAVESLNEGGYLFVGDIRNYELANTFYSSVEWARSSKDNATSLKELRQRIEKRRYEDSELLISPSYFGELFKNNGLVSKVVPLAKVGRFRSEMNKYRFDVFIQKSRSVKLDLKHDVKECFTWLPWQGEGALSSILKNANVNFIAFHNIENRRINKDCFFFECIQSIESECESKLVDELASEFISEGANNDYLQLANIKQLAEEHDFYFYPTFSPIDKRRLDFFFTKEPIISPNCPPLEPFENESTSNSSISSLINNPLIKRYHKQLLPMVREYMAQQLPEYMRPAHYMVLDKLPLTSNGKIDKKSLPEPFVEERVEAYIAPSTDTEHKLTKIWKDILSINSVGVFDNFFELGGHSLLATRVISAIRESFNIDLSLRALFERQTISGLAQLLDSSIVAEFASTKNIVPVDRSQLLPLSFAQQRLWFIDQLDNGSAQYNMPSAIKLKGHLSMEAVNKAIESMMMRHEILRTCFVEKNNGVYQNISSHFDCPIKVTNLTIDENEGNVQSRLSKLMQKESSDKFDLSKAPLFRVHLIILSEIEYVLLCTMHHIISDGWSINLFIEEFKHFYLNAMGMQSEKLVPMKIQYADYSVWQRNELTGEKLDRQLDFWKNYLSDIPTVHQLPLDKERPKRQIYSGRSLFTTLDECLSQRVNAFCQQYNVTLFMFLQLAYSILIARYSNEDDVVIGTPVAGRQYRELEPLIGLFVNTIALRTRIPKSANFLELLEQSKEHILDAFNHQSIPFELLVEELKPKRSLSHSPLFQILFTMQNNEQSSLSIEGLDIELMGAENSFVKFDLQLDAQEWSNQIVLGWTYNTSLFEEASINQLSASFQEIISSILAKPEIDVRNLNIVSEEQKQDLLRESLENTNSYPQYEGLHQLFEHQVMLSPNQFAMIVEGEKLTFRELNEKANHLAHYLVSQNVMEGDLVGICHGRNTQLLVSILAVFKTGAAYVPITPETPENRATIIARSANVKCVITESHWVDKFFEAKCRLVETDQPTLLKTVQAQSKGNLHLDTKDNEQREKFRDIKSKLAYTIFTSGSTGTPKGVQIEHKSLLNLTFNLRDIIGQESKLNNAFHSVQQNENNISWAWNASYGFDASLQAISQLAIGSTIHLLTDETRSDPEQLLNYFKVNQIDVFDCTPAHIAQILELEPEPILPMLFIGGEAISGHLWQQLISLVTKTSLAAYNVYGPTETTVDATFCKISPKHPLPHIGTFIKNVYGVIVQGDYGICPHGTVGELLIGGEGVGKGYLNQERLTSEEFVDGSMITRQLDADNLLNCSRFYRTGDLVKRLPDGNLAYVNRIDSQVKIRGFRIELGEIESQLMQLDQVKSVAVTSSNDDIFAYVVAHKHSNDSSIIDICNLHLKRKLPDYMVPSLVISLEQMPLTVNGKVDTRSLPEPNFKRTNNNYVAPRTDLEHQLCAIWAKFLHVERISIDDNFFRLGGHSLLATRVINGIRKAIDIEIPLTALFEFSTVESLANMIINESTSAKIPDILIADLHKPKLVSYSQRRLWLINQVENGSHQFNIPVSFTLEGQLDVDAFCKTVWLLIERHETLRTCYKEIGGEVEQVVLDSLDNPVVVLDLSDLSKETALERVAEVGKKDATALFELSSDIMIRVHLIKLSNDEHRVIFNVHHIAADGWSMGILLKEFSQIYSSLVRNDNVVLPQKTIKYIDFAIWQRSWLAGDFLQKQFDYWTKQLSNIPAIHKLPLDHKRPSVPKFEGASLFQVLDKELTRKLRSFCETQEVTLFMCLETAFALLIGRYSSTNDVVVGTPVAGRVHEQLESLVGIFINTLAIRTQYSGNETFNELLNNNKRVILDSFKHQHVPFEMLVEKLAPQRSFNYSPVFQILFSMQNNEVVDIELDGLNYIPENQAADIIKYDLELTASEINSEIHLSWTYDKALFEQATLERLKSAFEQLLLVMLDEPHLSVSKLPVYNESEQHELVVENNETYAPFSFDLCIHQLVQQCVDAPIQSAKDNLIALEFRDQRLTYAELNERSNQLAHYLIKCGVKPDNGVGICMTRSFEMVVAILATLKAGGAYVPIEPTLPDDRKNYIVENANISCVLTQSHNSSLSVLSDQIAIDTDSMKEILENQPVHTPEVVGLTSENLAYIIYTSGSTGTPKGVMVSHRALVNRIEWMQRKYQLTKEDKILQKTPYSFDVSVWEFFWPLTQGATLVIAEPEGHKDPQYLESVIIKKQITTLHFVPSMLSSMLSISDWRRCDSVQRVFCSGEALDKSLVKKFWQTGTQSELHNLYGPTEAAIDVSYWDCSAVADFTNTPIGKPIDNIQLYVLDKHMNPTPYGVPGELYIGGVGLARGYVNNVELTSDRFPQNPFINVKNNYHDMETRLYKTGDLARWLPQGEIEYLGRLDNQVKLRGFRIELGEIEQQLMSHEWVQEAAVLLNESAGSVPQLIAYIVCQQTQDIKRVLQDFLKTKLPEYMVPTVFKIMDEMPLTSNGKLDRKKLPAPVLEDIQTTTYRAPRNEVECTLCEIWQEVIGAETVGIDDNYFELGGNSIGTVQIVFAAENKGISLRIGDIMRYPTIANLSEILNKDNDTHATKRQRNTDPKSKVVGAGKSITTDLNKLSKLNANDMCWSTVVKLDDMTTETHIRHKVKNLLKTDKALTLSMDPSDNLHSEKAESFVLNEHYLPVNRQLVKSVLQLFDHQPNNSQLNEHIDNIVSALVEIVLKESGPLIRIAWTHDSHGCVYLIVVVHKLLKTDLEWQLFKEYLGGNQLVFPLPTE